MEKLLKITRTLTDIDGVSGDEKRVSAKILELIEGHYESAKIDALGNLIVFVKGEKAGKRIMVAAHMDEVGFMITDLAKSGLLNFVTVGGFDTRTMFGKRVRIFSSKTGKLVYGTVAYKSIHFMKGKFDELPELDELRIDIGASSKEEAEKLISIGDTAVFDSEFVEFGDDRLKAKALDDRAGCALMVNRILKGKLPYDTYFAFTVQEEVGCMGAVTSAYQIEPDFGIALEATTAADVGETPYNKQNCNQGQGAVISIIDRGTLYPREMYETAFKLAKDNGILAQPRRLAVGGTDASAIHKAKSGAKVMTMALPCRYIHSGSSMIKKSDYAETAKLLDLLLETFGEIKNK